MKTYALLCCSMQCFTLTCSKKSCLYIYSLCTCIHPLKSDNVQLDYKHTLLFTSQHVLKLNVQNDSSLFWKEKNNSACIQKVFNPFRSVLGGTTFLLQSVRDKFLPALNIVWGVILYLFFLAPGYSGWLDVVAKWLLQFSHNTTGSQWDSDQDFDLARYPIIISPCIYFTPSIFRLPS